MENSGVIIGGCCRNVEQYLPKVLENITTIGGLFRDYTCIFVESDSQDRTLDLLRKFQPERTKVVSLGDLKSTYNQATERLAICRNTLLEMAWKISQSGNFRYLLVLDMDNILAGPLDLEGWKSNFKYSDWTVMTANNPRYYYDIWALRCSIMDRDCWEDFDEDINQGIPGDQSFQNRIGKYQQMFAKSPETPLIPVTSAFGGAAFYDLEKLNPAYRYSGFRATSEDRKSRRGLTVPGKRYLCEHVPFHEQITQDGGKIFINPRFILNF